MVPEATESLGNLEVGIWLLVGGGVFVFADTIIDRRFGESGAMGIVVGNINDALPESLIFGIRLGAGLVLSLPFVAAVWISNIPQVIPPAAASWLLLAGRYASKPSCGVRSSSSPASAS